MGTEAPIEVASPGNEWGEDRKWDLVVRKLVRYDVVVGALHEPKCFSCGTYEVDNSMVLTSGRSAHREGQTLQQCEGVALRQQAIARGGFREGCFGCCSTPALNPRVRINGNYSECAYNVEETIVDS